jgi:hypothetical protein
MISFSPTEEQQMIASMVKEFASDEMRKIYRECDESGEIPDSIIDTAWKMGLFPAIYLRTMADLAGSTQLSQDR